MKEKQLFPGVEHIGIKAIDIEKSVEFYTKVLGLTVLNRMKPADKELVFLKLGQTVIELVEAGKGERFQDGAVNHLAIRVDDINAAVEFLRQQRVTLISSEPIPIGNGKYVFFFRGPSGEKLELFQGK